MCVCLQSAIITCINLVSMIEDLQCGEVKGNMSFEGMSTSVFKHAHSYTVFSPFTVFIIWTCNLSNSLFLLLLHLELFHKPQTSLEWSKHIGKPIKCKPTGWIHFDKSLPSSLIAYFSTTCHLQSLEGIVLFYSKWIGQRYRQGPFVNKSLRNVLIKSAHWWAREVSLSTPEEKSNSFSKKLNNGSDGRAPTDKRRIHNSWGAKAFFLTFYYVCILEMLGSDFPADCSVPVSFHSLAHQSIIIKYVFDFLTIHSLLTMNRDVESERTGRENTLNKWPMSEYQQ